MGSSQESQIQGLTDASFDAFVLAIETVNRPSVRYRLQASSMLFCNAWELLMKARLLAGGDSIYYRERGRATSRSIALQVCVGRLLNDVNDPVRVNIEDLSELRDSATHFVIPFIPPDIVGLFQATSINYARKLKEWFSIGISERVPVGLTVINFDVDPASYSLGNPTIRTQLSDEAVQWLEWFQNRIHQNAMRVGTRGSEYVVRIEYHVSTVRNPVDADNVLQIGGGDQGQLLIEVPKDIDKTHPWYESDLVDYVNSKLGGRRHINGYDIRCVIKAHDIPSKSPYVWKSVREGNRTKYSESMADWVLKKFEHDENFFSSARAKVREM